MAIYVPPKLTWNDLQEFPEDGKRYEIIEGELFVAASPSKRHQRLLKRAFRVFVRAIEDTGWGEVFFSPVDVKFTEDDVVEPDLIAIRRERMHIYTENPVVEAPDIVLEVISPSSRNHDQVRKATLYAAHGVPEYWIADAVNPGIRLLALRDGQWTDVEPDSDGRLHSTVCPHLILDPETLLANLDG